MSLATLLAAAPTPAPGGGGGPAIPDYGGGSGGGANSCVANGGAFCFDWLQDNSETILTALGKHVQLSLISLVAGFIIAFALALLAYRLRWLSVPITFLSSVLFTIPSIAAFYILIQYTGLEDITAEIALVSYTLLILFTNTLAGLTGVSPDVRDAAEGLGMTRLQLLRKVELPLAVPTIVAGLRVAAVTIISLVTVAGLIGLGGLGDIIYTLGVKRNINTALVVGGLLCIALALVADAILVVAQRLVTPWASARRSR